MQVHFHFQSELATNDLIFPKAIRHLIVNLPVQELDLAFVRGRWVCQRAVLQLQLYSTWVAEQPNFCVAAVCR